MIPARSRSGRGRAPAVLAVAGLLAVVTAGCGGDDEAPEGEPLVHQVDAALDAVDDRYGGPQDYFEVVALHDSVSAVVAVDGGTAAEAITYTDGELDEPSPLGPADGSTFRADQVELDPDRIFDRLRDDLPDSTIVDLAIQGGASGSVIYDARVESPQGGMLLVLLGPTGEILGTQAS